jgi:hypothetical protein
MAASSLARRISPVSSQSPPAMTNRAGPARMGTRRRRRRARSRGARQAPVGADLEITSTVPIGGGCRRARRSRWRSLRAQRRRGFELPASTSLAAQRAEHAATGVPCGRRICSHPCSGGRGTPLPSTAERTRSNHRPRRPACSSCTRRPHAGGTLQRRAESIEVGARSGCALRDATPISAGRTARRHAVMTRVRHSVTPPNRRRRRARGVDARKSRVVT